MSDDVSRCVFAAIVGWEKFTEHVHCVRECHEVREWLQLGFVLRSQVTSNSHFVLARSWSEALSLSMSHGLHGWGVVDLDELVSKTGAILEGVERFVFFRKEADNATMGWLASSTLAGFI